MAHKEVMEPREDIARVDTEKQKYRQKVKVCGGRNMVGKCVGLGIILRLARRLGIVGAKRFDMAIVLDERVRNGRAPDAVGILNLTAGLGAKIRVAR